MSSESGACPRCGGEPPAAIDAASAPDPKKWADVAGGARKLDIGPSYWLGAAALCIAIGVVAALLAVKLF